MHSHTAAGQSGRAYSSSLPVFFDQNTPKFRLRGFWGNLRGFWGKIKNPPLRNSLTYRDIERFSKPFSGLLNISKYLQVFRNTRVRARELRLTAHPLYFL